MRFISTAPDGEGFERTRSSIWKTRQEKREFSVDNTFSIFLIERGKEYLEKELRKRKIAISDFYLEDNLKNV